MSEMSKFNLGSPEQILAGMDKDSYNEKCATNHSYRKKFMQKCRYYGWFIYCFIVADWSWGWQCDVNDGALTPVAPGEPSDTDLSLAHYFGWKSKGSNSTETHLLTRLARLEAFISTMHPLLTLDTRLISENSACKTRSSVILLTRPPVHTLLTHHAVCWSSG